MMIRIVMYVLGLDGSMKPEMMYSLAPLDPELFVLTATRSCFKLLLTVPLLDVIVSVDEAVNSKGLVKVNVLLLALPFVLIH